MLRHDLPYRDLGPDDFDKLHGRRLERALVKRLEGLGYTVDLTPRKDAA